MGTGSPIGQILERWNQIPRGRQMALAGIVGGTIVVFYLVFIASSAPNMVTAYSGLDPEDAASIAAELQKAGIAYDLGANGTTVSVAAEKVGEARIKLASAGLPRNGASIGFEVFDKTNFGATDYVQQVNYQRALEGELARSINSIDSVKASRVHLVLPKESVFKEDQDKTTASVLLQLKAGRDLTQDQVRGITNLVSNSVPGLASGGVTIMDQTGHVLFDGSTFDNPFSTGASATQMDLQRKYETALSRDVQATLDKVVGAGRSAVTVRAKLNFDTVTSKADTFGTAAQAVPRSSSSVTETFNGSNLNVGNVPGTGTNGAAAGAGTTANGNSTYSRTETTTNNEVPRTETTTVRAPGALDRLSVSVVLDESVTAAQEQALTSAVAAAVGIDQTRGDTLNVARLPFDASVREDLVGAAGDGLGQYLQYLKLILPILAVALAFVLVTLLLKSLSKRQLALTAPSQHQLALQAAAAIPHRSLGPAAPLPALEAAPDPAEERVHTLAAQNPRAVADVVQTWMREEDA
ncbi:MAG TPA: flagellar basal-body MS-ring/collar protein FliF [Tepidiformaceae bacterium]|nr:flagellar M-ring protein FliF [Thermoflexaceae bacterium]HMS57526.1 flagellar basal-body MS-ring/collar protein FliF [Tepidiformaceae bacterium]